MNPFQAICATLLAGLLLVCAEALHGDDRIDHFQPLPSATLADAMNNLNSHTAELQQLLQQDRLQPADLHKIHQLSYTLEAAVNRLQVSSAVMAVDIVAMHEASETGDAAVTRERGQRYLEAVQQLLSVSADQR